MPVQEKKSEERRTLLLKKVQFFENLANVAATNTETDLAISLYDELINRVPEFRFPKGLGHIGCFT